MVDGARVTDVFPHQGSSAVKANWSGGRWEPSSGGLLRHYRDRLLLGVWRIAGVDVPYGYGADAIVRLVPQEGHQPIKANDILILGDGVYSTVQVKGTAVPPFSPVEVGAAGYHGLTGGEGDTDHLLVFHEADATLERVINLPGRWRGIEVVFELDDPRFVHPLDYPVEIKLPRPLVSVHQVVQLLQPLRHFVLDVGQELLFRTQRASSGKRLSATYTYFEPLFSAMPGSVRLFIHAAQPEQIPLFVDSKEPLRLFAEIMAAAARGDVEGVVSPLSSTVFSVDELLKKAARVAEAADISDGFLIRTPDDPDGFMLTPNSAPTIRKGIQSIETRQLKRTGVLYGMDLMRKWFRLTVETDGGMEDWTIAYGKALEGKVRGQAPRAVEVTFDTKTRPDMLRGTGVAVNLRNLDTPAQVGQT